ncbi:MAG: CopD family protein [Halobacteriota archaeon]
MIDFAAASTHLLFASIWVGGVFFMAFAVVPAARDGRLDARLLSVFLDRFGKVSLVSAVVLFVTGGHMAGTRYSVESLTTSLPGYLVLVMLVLWAVLLGLLQYGGYRLDRDVERGSVREPASSALIWYRLAVGVSVVLLVVAAALSNPAELETVLQHL